MATELREAKIKVVVDTAPGREQLEELEKFDISLKERILESVRKAKESRETQQKEMERLWQQKMEAGPTPTFNRFADRMNRMASYARDPMSGAESVIQKFPVAKYVYEAAKGVADLAEKAPEVEAFVTSFFGGKNPTISKFFDQVREKVVTARAYAEALPPAMDDFLAMQKAALRLGGKIPLDEETKLYNQMLILQQNQILFEKNVQQHKSKEVWEAIGRILGNSVGIGRQ